jgi:hypothetical protein
MPSRKWFAAQVSAIGALVVALINNGWELTPELQVVLVGMVVQAIVTYLVPNVAPASVSSTHGTSARPAPTQPQRA